MDEQQLPPLPESVDLMQAVWRGGHEFMRPVGSYYTAAQMRDYARAALAMSPKATSGTSEQQERSAFEAAARNHLSPLHLLDFERLDDGRYKDNCLYAAIWAWQARAALAANVPAGLIDAARKVVREALDSVDVHPCDENNDTVRARGLTGPVAKLHALLAAAPAPEAEPAQAPPQLEPGCNPHPDAPHGFNRDASNSADRYVCDCYGWAPAPAPAQAQQPSLDTRRWPFLESPASFARRLETALAEFPDTVAAVRHVLIEKPPAQLAAKPEAQQPLTDEQFKQAMRECFNIDLHTADYADDIVLFRWVEKACAEAWGVKLIGASGEGKSNGNG